MRRLGLDEAVTTDNLAKICKCLECKVDDIMDVIDVNKKYDIGVWHEFIR